MLKPPKTIQRPAWFGNERASTKLKNELGQVDALVDDTEQWALDILRPSQEDSVELSGNAGTDELARIPSLFMVTKEKLEQEVQVHQVEPDSNSFNRLALSEVRKTKEHKESWSLKRKSGARNIGTGVQRFCNAFSSYLSAYTGIVEVVKGIDNQYGGLAYGTLSVLLSVAVRKQQHEEAIEKGLEELSTAFPRLEILESIYPSTKIQELVIEVFKETVRFARISAAYYNKSSTRKILETTKASSKHSIEESLSIIRHRLAEVRFESENLMQKRISDLTDMVRGLETRLDESQASTDAKHLREIRRALKISDVDQHLDIVRYRRHLNTIFAESKTNTDAPAYLTWNLIEQEPSYVSWEGASNSSLLMLSGENWAGERTLSTLCWLSQIAVLLVEKQLSENRNIIYYCCQTSFTITDRQRVTIQNLMANLVYQLLSLRSKPLRSGTQDLKEIFTSPEWCSEEEDTALPVMANLLLLLLGSFSEKETVTIVIDRLDTARIGCEDLTSEGILEALLNVTTKAKCIVKILIITSSSRSWKPRKWEMQKLKKIGKDAFLERHDWDAVSRRARALTPD